MRIRTVKPELFRHEELFDLEKETGLPIRLCWIGLFCASDREGRFQWKTRALGSEVLPFDNIDFSRVLDALATRGFVVKYRVNTDWYGCIPTFCRHQVINNRERPSQIPPLAEAQEVVMYDLTRAPRVNDACPTPLNNYQGERKGKEQGKEGNKERKSLARAASDNSIAEEIYQLYPKKVAKADALKAITKALTVKPAEVLKERTKAFADAWAGHDLQFCPYPATWFNKHHFDDDPAAWNRNSTPTKPTHQAEANLARDNTIVVHEMQF